MGKNEKKLIVVVDDDEAIISILKSTFETRGFPMQTFTDGNSAKTFLSNSDNLSQIALLILDRILPDMEGIDLLKELAKQSEHQVPVLILSALSSEQDVLHGLKEGAVDYVTKPFSISILVQKAMRLMQK